jgi:hypothetical protein
MMNSNAVARPKPSNSRTAARFVGNRAQRTDASASI